MYQASNAKCRCTLAFLLASSILVLHGTPWLSSSWSTEDVHLISSISSNGKLGDPPLPLPYITRTFAPLSNAPLSQSKSRPYVKNETVFALGIVLLELSHGQDIVSMKTADESDAQGNETPFSDFLIANRLVVSISQRELPNYSRAVTKCISCDFGTPTYNLEDETFRDRFYENVVVPLQQDYQYAMGG